MEAHAVDVGLLPFDVFCAHVDDAFHVEEGACECGGGAVLSGAGFGDDAFFAHLFGQEDLADYLVGFVGAAVDEVFAFEEDPHVPGLIRLSPTRICRQRQIRTFRDGCWPAEVVAEEASVFGHEFGVVPRFDEGCFELVECGDE